MGELIPSTARRRRRRRWTAADKAHHLAAFARSGLSIKEFCAQADVPRSSFTLWQHQARMLAKGTAPTPRGRPSFAQVEVVPSVAPAGITLVIRSGQDVVVELAGLDARVAVTLLSTALKHRRR